MIAMQFIKKINFDEIIVLKESWEGITLSRTKVTTKSIDRFIENEDNTIKLNLGYSVYIGKDDENIYYYYPYIQLKKERNINKQNHLNYITISRLKDFTHDSIHKWNDYYDLDYTYCRKKDNLRMPEMSKFVKFIDVYLNQCEEFAIKERKINNKNSLYKLLAQEENITRDISELFVKHVLGGLKIKAQDSEYHNSTIGDGYYFEIGKIGAKYKNKKISK